MIYRGGKLILEVSKNIHELVEGAEQKTQRQIGAIYKGSKLVWLTIYNAIYCVYNSGKWLGDKTWTQLDKWKAN